MQLGLIRSLSLSTLLMGAGLVVYLSLFKLSHWLTLSVNFALGYGVYALMLPAMYFLVTTLNKRVHGPSQNDYGLSIKGLRGFCLGLPLGLSLVALAVALLLLSPNVSLQTPPQSALTPQHVSSLTFLVTIVSTTEEILFRGLVFTTLLISSGSALFAVLWSAVLFALVHVLLEQTSWVWFTALLSLGVVFAFIYNRSGNCWVAAGFHVGFNLAGEIAKEFFSVVAGANQLQWILAVILCVIALALLWLVGQRPTDSPLLTQASSESV